MSSEPVRYSIVGLGRAGWDIHVNQLRSRPDAKIVAVVDSVKERLDQAAAELGCRTYRHFPPMLKQNDVEVVVIATPSVLHGPQAIQALKAGKHVVVEKPMAMNLNQAKRMIASAKGSRRKLFVHQNYRFLPLASHFQEIVNSRILGRLYHIRICLSNFIRRNDWQTLVRNGGGVLNNTGAHYIDLLLQLIGAPAANVMGDLQHIASSGDAEDHVKALIRGENGVTGDLEIGNAQNVAGPLPKWVLCGTHGTLTCDGKTSTIRWFDPNDVQSLDVINMAAPDRRYGNDDRIPWQERTVSAESACGENFYDNVFNVLRNDMPMRVTPESVMEVMRVIAMIRKGTRFPGKISTRKRQTLSKVR